MKGFGVMVGRVGLTFASVGLVPKELYLEYRFLWTALTDVRVMKRFLWRTPSEHLLNSCPLNKCQCALVLIQIFFSGSTVRLCLCPCSSRHVYSYCCFFCKIVYG